MKRQLKVGDTLWFAGHRESASRQVVVTKVGKKWAELDCPMRICLKTWEVDGGNYMSPGHCWESKEEYDAFQLLHKSWWAFADSIRKSKPPAGMTVERIREAASVLGINLEKEIK